MDEPIDVSGGTKASHYWEALPGGVSFCRHPSGSMSLLIDFSYDYCLHLLYSHRDTTWRVTVGKLIDPSAATPALAWLDHQLPPVPIQGVTVPPLLVGLRIAGAYEQYAKKHPEWLGQLRYAPVPGDPLSATESNAITGEAVNPLADVLAGLVAAILTPTDIVTELHPVALSDAVRLAEDALNHDERLTAAATALSERNGDG